MVRVLAVFYVATISLPSLWCVGGVTVSIVAFQAVDPGSTPGQRTFFFLHCQIVFFIFRSLERRRKESLSFLVRMVIFTLLTFLYLSLSRLLSPLLSFHPPFLYGTLYPRLPKKLTHCHYLRP